MRCEGFEQRLNGLLDERRSLDADSEMTAHLLDCADCRALLAGYELLLDAVDARPEIDPPPNMTERVTAQLAAPPARPVARVATALVLAASLLVAVAAWFLYARDPAAPNGPAAPPLANIKVPAGADAHQAARDASPAEDEMALAYRSMFQRTGQAMATFPDTVRRTSQRPEVGAVAESIRPVTASFSTVLDSLRRTLPSKSDGSKS